MIHVFLLDDHEMVRRGVADLVNTQPDMEVVGDAATGADALAAIEATRPDVAVLDISLGEGNGIEVCRQITSRFPGVACLMLTSVLDERALMAARDAGAAAFALKTVGSGELVDSIRKVASGSQLLDGHEARAAQRRLIDRGENLIDELTPQERRIFDLIGGGRSNREIADELYLAEKTVKNYVSNMLAKLGMARRTEVAALSARIVERESGWRA